MRELRDLPKAHLHLHLEGAMRMSTLRELCRRSQIEVPVVSTSYGSFADFEDTYMAACDVLRSEGDLRRLVAEVVEDAAADGAAWVEPAIYLPHHRQRIGPNELVIEAILDELRRASAAHGIGAGLMVAADRTLDPADAVAQAQLAVAYRDEGVVSFGLANDEAAGPPEAFAEAFKIARGGGLISAPHAGEHRGPESVAGALDALGANRIEHGVRAIEDPELVKRLADSAVCLDVCPTSNVLLSVFPSLEAHSLPALLAAGVRCSINGDDPLLFGPNLLEEYELCRNRMGLDDDRLAFIARCSLGASGAPADLKARELDAVGRWLAGPG
ncbi:MAG TPA: adenosine deaminase [Acidimicrobiales bacterium]|nr:adenosine deaminase [Acidimicrobiales bacterium]